MTAGVEAGGGWQQTAGLEGRGVAKAECSAEVRSPETGLAVWPQAVVESISNPVFVKNEALRYVYVNPAMEEFLAMPREQILGRTDEEIFGKEVAAEVNKTDGEVLEGKTIAEEPAWLPGGATCAFRITKVPLRDPRGRVIAVGGIIRKVSFCRRASESLRLGEQLAEQCKCFFEEAPLGVCVVNENIVVYANQVFLRMFGISSLSEVVGASLLDYLASSCHWEVAERIRLLQAGRLVPSSYEAVGRRINKTQFPVQLEFARLETGTGAAILCFLSDITDQKIILEERQESQQWFSRAFKNNPLPMMIVNYHTAQLIDVNEEFLQATGYCREEVIGKSVRDLDIWATTEQYDWLREMILSHRSIRNLEVRIVNRRSEERIWLFSIDVMRLGGKKCLFGIINDITERRQLESEIARLDRLNLVGEMAASIAHEIRNPLSIVKGFLQLMITRHNCWQCSSDYGDYFELMLSELERANTIVNELLGLSRKKAAELKPCCLNRIVQSLYPLLQADALIADKFVRLELDEVPLLPLDEKEICQLVLNLARNGLEAMGAGGVLTISTFQRGKEVILAIKDQGDGIDPHVMQKMGTPFFTTKENGTGLGLAVCRSIVARHNAHINVATGSAGTTFFVEFKAP